MPERTQGVSEIVGMFLTLIGGAFAIGAGVTLYTENHHALWGFLLIVAGTVILSADSFH